jgi:rhodanese-related sulfurtransferase
MLTASLLFLMITTRLNQFHLLIGGCNYMSTITPEEIKKRMEQGETLTLIDVREDEEVAAGMIPGAIHIRMSEIPARQEEISRSEEVILVCRSGARSGRVQEYLEEQGFTGLKNMVGGMLGWEKLS